MGEKSSRPFRPMRWWVAAVAAFGVVAVSALAYLILGTATGGVTDANVAATLDVQIIRTSLSVGAGVAGGGALLLAFRRQVHQEHVSIETSHGRVIFSGATFAHAMNFHDTRFEADAAFECTHADPDVWKRSAPPVQEEPSEQVTAA